MLKKYNQLFYTITKRDQILENNGKRAIQVFIYLQLQMCLSLFFIFHCL